MLCRNELSKRQCLWEHKEDVNRRVTIMEGRFVKQYAEDMLILCNGASSKLCNGTKY